MHSKTYRLEAQHPSSAPCALTLPPRLFFAPPPRDPVRRGVAIVVDSGVVVASQGSVTPPTEPSLVPQPRWRRRWRRPECAESTRPSVARRRLRRPAFGRRRAAPSRDHDLARNGSQGGRVPRAARRLGAPLPHAHAPPRVGRRRHEAHHGKKLACTETGVCGRTAAVHSTDFHLPGHERRGVRRSFCARSTGPAQAVRNWGYPDGTVETMMMTSSFCRRR
jgi:hypothetical protein